MTKKSGPLYFLLIVALIVLTCVISAGCKTKDKDVHRLNEKLEIEQVKSYTITTVIDTTVKVPGAVVKASEPLTQILAGDTLKAENNGTKVTVYYDKATGNINAKAETQAKNIPVFAKTTETGNIATKGNYAKKEVDKTTTVKSDIGGNVKLAVIIIVLLAIVAFGIFIWYKLSRLPTLPPT